MIDLKKIVICEGGNAAHVQAALMSSRYQVAMYALYGDEAARLQAGCERTDGIVARAGERQWQGCPWRISADAADVFSNANMVLWRCRQAPTL